MNKSKCVCVCVYNVKSVTYYLSRDESEEWVDDDEADDDKSRKRAKEFFCGGGGEFHYDEKSNRDTHTHI
jgi:hypothetical protein